MEFITSKGIEKEIILAIKKHPKGITELAKELKKDKGTIGKTIERMMNQDLVFKNHDYLNDSKKTLISLNPKKIKIKQTHTFYLRYFGIVVFSMIFSFLLTFIFNSINLIIGTIIGILPNLIYMGYNVYITNDKIIVEKLIKTTKFKIKIKRVDNNHQS